MNTYTATVQAYKNGYEAGVREFAERLCEDRVSNDPVVIAVKVELKELIDKQRKEDGKND
jgi:hypothetical protein